MSSISSRRALLALTLAALVGLPSLAVAAPRPQRQAHREVPGSLVAQAWSIFQHLGGLEGMMIDPNGSRSATAAGLTHLAAPTGMSIDPDGRSLGSVLPGTRTKTTAGSH